MTQTLKERVWEALTDCGSLANACPSGTCGCHVKARDALALARTYAAEMVDKALRKAEKVAQGPYLNQSEYDERSPLYGSDLNPDRSEIGRGRQTGRTEAAMAVRALAEMIRKGEEL